MATIQPTVTEFNRARTRRVSWAGLTNVDDGAPIDWSAHSDKSVQVIGTFGGATVVIQGSNDLENPTNWTTLTDLLGNALSFTAAGLEQITENTCWIRPVCSGGAGPTSVTVQMLLRGNGGF